MLTLATYASPLEPLVGRVHPEARSRYRSEHQRDRDRIVHSAAFRRLEHKTQVFASYDGDMFRTRLTHTIEVAQIARTIACALNLNETLTEAIALAHDLGHAPFGHAGQHALDICNAAYGGFEHNLHGLRVVEVLEDRYAAFPGLNLTFETRQGILKHCSRERAASLGDLGSRFLRGEQPSLEAQVANLADEIAYNNHDVDDGLRAGLLDLDEVFSHEPLAAAHTEVLHQWPALEPRRRIHEVIRRSINAQVSDVIQHSQMLIQDSGVATPADVAMAGPLIALSPLMERHHRNLKRYLRDALYQHHRVHRMAIKGRRIVTELHAAFMAEPRLLPKAFRRGEVGAVLAEAVTDYLAGMTDRFALQEYARVFQAGVPT
jgi:dGTPase